MKFLLIAVSFSAVVALAQSKFVPGQVVFLNEEGNEKMEEAAESVAALMDADLNRLAEEGFQVPLLSRSCTNSACLNICNEFGYKHGVCILAATCQCSN